MPLLFLIVGLVLIVTVVRGTLSDLASAIADDLTSGYLKWFAAIVAIGLIGYIPAAKEPSRYLLILVAIVILLTGGAGFISMFSQAIATSCNGATPAPAGGNANLPAIPIQQQGAAGAAQGAAAAGQGVLNSSPLGTAMHLAPIIGSVLGL